MGDRFLPVSTESPKTFYPASLWGFLGSFRLCPFPGLWPGVPLLSRVLILAKTFLTSEQGEAKVSNKLYVGNLSYQANEEDLTELFQRAGTVASVKIITDIYSGQSRGFGFVEMSSDEEARNAIGMLNGYRLKGKEIVVNEARPQQSRGGGGGGRGGGGGGRGGGGGGGRRGRY